MSVEADFQDVIVVWSDTETGHKAVYIQVQVLSNDVLATGKSFTVGGRVE